MVSMVLLVLVLPVVGFQVSYLSSGFRGSSSFCGSCGSACTMEHVHTCTIEFNEPTILAML